MNPLLKKNKKDVLQLSLRKDEFDCFERSSS